jgi:hypothetical protein
LAKEAITKYILWVESAVGILNCWQVEKVISAQKYCNSLSNMINNRFIYDHLLPWTFLYP